MRASIKFYALVGGLLALALAPFIIWLGQMTFAPAIITAVVLLALGGLGGSLVALDRKPWLP
jgi:hypothetical protein